MRGGVGAVAVFLSLLLAVPLADAGSKPPSVLGSMKATASPHVPGAQGIRLRLTLRYEMHCDYPGAGPLVVTFPRAVKLPKRFATGAVRLAGKPVVATLDKRQVTVTVARHKGLLCDLMGLGSLKLTFTQAAKLANPVRAGSYGFQATHAGRAFAARLRIKTAQRPD